MKTKIPDVSTEKCVQDVDETSVSLDIWTLKEGRNFEFIAKENKILFIISGSLTCSLSGCEDAFLDAGKMIFVSIGIRCLINTKEGVSVVCLKPGLILKMYNFSEYGRIPHKGQPSGNILAVLKLSPILSAYVESLKWFLNMSFKDPLYIGIKIRELFYLMSISYTLHERNSFFQALASKDNNFSDFIYQNYRKAQSIHELASLSCYSRSGFGKHFRKVFGVSASHWITLRRAGDIYQDICRSRKSIKQICFDYGFSSLSHFHKFCKSKFGLSPGRIRKQIQID